MRYRVIPILIIIIIIFIGHIIKRLRISRYIRRAEFTVEYNNNFFDLVNKIFSTGRLDEELYNYCLHDMDKIQQELGNDGILAGYIDRLHGVKGTNYQLFMNIMPEIRGMLSFDNIIIRERVQQLIGCCEDALKRHIGNLDRAIEKVKNGLFNPFSCFGEGIRWITGLPFDILLWCGLISVSNNQRVKTNKIFKFISNIIVFVGLISSIMTVVLGWNDFIGIIKNFI